MVKLCYGPMGQRSKPGAPPGLLQALAGQGLNQLAVMKGKFYRVPDLKKAALQYGPASKSSLGKNGPSPSGL